MKEEKRVDFHPIKSGYIQLDHFMKEVKRKGKAISEGLICPLCNSPMKIMNKVCKCPNDCFEYSHRIEDMKEIIQLAKTHKKGIFREE